MFSVFIKCQVTWLVLGMQGETYTQSCCSWIWNTPSLFLQMQLNATSNTTSSLPALSVRLTLLMFMLSFNLHNITPPHMYMSFIPKIMNTLEAKPTCCPSINDQNWENLITLCGVLNGDNWREGLLQPRQKSGLVPEAQEPHSSHPLPPAGGWGQLFLLFVPPTTSGLLTHSLHTQKGLNIYWNAMVAPYAGLVPTFGEKNYPTQRHYLPPWDFKVQLIMFMPRA